MALTEHLSRAETELFPEWTECHSAAPLTVLPWSALVRLLLAGPD